MTNILFSLLENVDDKGGLPEWLQYTLGALGGTAGLSAILAVVYNKLPLLKSILKIICKATFDEKECTKNKKSKEKSKKVNKSRK